MSDWTLLEHYVHEDSESAFRELVETFTPLVYSSALRRVGSAQAEDVTQSVFLLLARKAPDLCRKPRGSLAGWLYRTTRFASLEATRERQRREQRETQAGREETPIMPSDITASIWRELRPLLDEALDHLSRGDREALILRYLQDAPYATVAHALGVSENTATKRTARALERLRSLLARRGVTAPAALLSATLLAHTAEAAPASLLLTCDTWGRAGATTVTAATLLADRLARSLLWQQLRVWLAATLTGTLVVSGSALGISRALHPPPPLRLVGFLPRTLAYRACTTLPDGTRRIQINTAPDGRSHFMNVGDHVAGYQLAPLDPPTGALPAIVLQGPDGPLTLELNAAPTPISWSAALQPDSGEAMRYGHPGGTVHVAQQTFDVISVTPNDGTVVLHATGQHRTTTLHLDPHPKTEGDTP